MSVAESLTHTSSPQSISFDDEELVWKEKFDKFNYGFRRAEGYLQARYDPLSLLSVALGVRFDYLNLTENSQFSRAAVLVSHCQQLPSSDSPTAGTNRAHSRIKY